MNRVDLASETIIREENRLLRRSGIKTYHVLHVQGEIIRYDFVEARRELRDVGFEALGIDVSLTPWAAAYRGIGNSIHLCGTDFELRDELYRRLRRQR